MNQKVQEALEMVYRRAAIDPEFRQLCLEDASAAIEEVGGPEQPDVPVRFVEKLEEQVLVLPPLLPTEELDELELEMVAGGTAAAGAGAAQDRSCVCRWTAARGTTFSTGSVCYVDVRTTATVGTNK